MRIKEEEKRNKEKYISGSHEATSLRLHSIKVSLKEERHT